jgi:hypothetical protein
LDSTRTWKGDKGKSPFDIAQLSPKSTKHQQSTSMYFVLKMLYALPMAAQSMKWIALSRLLF